MAAISPKKEFITSLITWALIIAGIRIVGLFPGIPFLAENTTTITAILLIYPPVLLSIVQRQPIHFWRIEKKNLWLSLKVLVIVCLIIFPAAFVINHFYQKLFFDISYHPGRSDVWGIYMMTQLVLISFPEEFFFRGYLQEAFNKVMPAKRTLLGVPFGWNAVILSLIFALSHSLITLRWWHIFIFFPALMFTWLKERTGTIWAATFFHWACNLFAYWVSLHY